MKTLAAAFAMALVAGPALAQQQGRIMMQAPAASAPKGGITAGSIRPAQPFQPPAGPNMQEKSGAFGAMQQRGGSGRPSAFNTELKPLYGVGPAAPGRSRR